MVSHVKRSFGNTDSKESTGHSGELLHINSMIPLCKIVDPDFLFTQTSSS